MTQKIITILQQQFETNRIIFWYDEQKELFETYNSLQLPEVTKEIINNNEYSLKYRILKEQPKQKFLLYHSGQKPEDINNWLLDVLLSNSEFSADQTSLYLSELELDYSFKDLVNKHLKFFGSEKNVNALKVLLNKNDNINTVSLKILSVCLGCDARIDLVVEALLHLVVKEDESKCKLITRCNLFPEIWDILRKEFAYASNNPSLKDFAIELFKSCNNQLFKNQFSLNEESYIFLSRFRDSIKNYETFEALSNNFEKLLNIPEQVHEMETIDLLSNDLFDCIDMKIISDLITRLEKGTILIQDIQDILDKRRQSHWYSKYKDIYATIELSSLFLHSLSQISLEITSFSDGINKYSDNWALLDQYYRKMIAASNRSKQTSLLQPLLLKVEALYVNNFLLQMGDNWQTIVDKLDRWDTSSSLSQNLFFEKHVKEKFLSKNKKVVVIISDALRYEVGLELLGKIRAEDRYEGSIEPIVTMLPSFTQIGMASLLPHKQISMKDEKNQLVTSCDGISSLGTSNREKILKSLSGYESKVILSKDLFDLNRDDSRVLFKDHEVIYVYHNLIDSIGDKKDSEHRVCEEAEEAINEIIQLIKKMTGANATNIIVTSDHGFIYQHQPIDESDFSVAVPEGDITYNDRRFIIGRNLKKSSELKTLTAEQLGIVGEQIFQFPKSINRLRLKGSGSRFVHGGITLQEIVIPVININKKRSSDTAQVDIEILRGSSNIISSGQISVRFYQKDSVLGKILPRTLRIGIYSKEQEILSNVININFDSTAESPRERERQEQFVLSKKADKYNGDEVMLKLEELEPGTSYYKEYRSVPYIIRRSFISDFDL